MAEPTNPGQNTGDEEEQERLFDGNDPDEVKETVAAGLTSEEIGINALSSDELSDPTRPENHAGGEKSAQEVTNELDESAQGYASGHDSGVSQKEQYDVAMSGAAIGRHEGTYFDEIQQQRELKLREERRNIAVRAVTTYAQLLNFGYQIGQDLAETAADVAETASRVAETERVMNEVLEQYDDTIEEKQNRIDELLERQRDGSLSDAEMAELTTTQTQVDNLQMVRDALANERDQLVEDQRNSEQALAEAQQAYNEKMEEVREAQRTGEGDIDALRRELADLGTRRDELDAQNVRVNKRVDFALEGAEQYEQLRMALTSPELNQSPDAAQAVSAFAAEFINARADGEISQDDMTRIRARLQDPNMPEQAKVGIAEALQASIAGSGVGVQQADGTYVYGQDALDTLLGGLQREVEAADTDYAEISSDATQTISQLESQRATLQDELTAHREELEAIENGTSALLLGAGGLGALGEGFAQNDDTPEEMQAAQRALKMAEIENAESRLALLDNTIGRTQEQLDQTRQSYVEAHQHLRDLQDQKAISGNDDRFDAQIAETQARIDNYRDEIEALGDRAILAQAVSELAIRIEGKSNSCGANAAVEYAKADVINARTAVANYIGIAAEDGKISQNEMDNIHIMFKTAQISDASRDAFVRAFAATGGEVQDASGEYVSGAEASAILASQIAEVREQQVETREQIASTSEDRAEIQQQIAALQAQRAEQQQTLDNAQAALDTESAETAEIVADAQGAQAGMMAYESVFDYMSTNYSHMMMGSGESVSEVAAQADRMLTDNAGNLVYVNPDTQEMYTLAKNDDGSVARDSNGAQIKVAVSAEDTADLYREMFDNKLLPRNFVPDGDGFLGMGKTEVAFAEHSEHDSFSESIGKSLIPGAMGKEEFSQVIENSVAAQRAEEEAARLAQAEAQSDIEGARLALEQASNDLNATDAEIQRLTRELASLQEKEQQLQLQQEVAQGADRDAVAAIAATDSNASALNMTETLANLEAINDGLQERMQEIRAAEESGYGFSSDSERLQQEASDLVAEGDALLEQINQASEGQSTEGWDGTESMSLETSEEYQQALVDVYRRVESGSINKNDLDQALGDNVAPELRQQIEAALERDGIDINEPENEVASDLDNTNDDVQLASNAQMTASFPFLGIGPFQVDQIPTAAPSPDPNGIYPSMKYESFADSMEFASTNPTNGPEPTYLDPVNNGTKDTPSAGDTFAMALTNTGAPDTGASVKPPQLSPEEAIRLQREEELRMAENQAGLNSTTSMV